LPLLNIVIHRSKNTVYWPFNFSFEKYGLVCQFGSFKYDIEGIKCLESQKLTKRKVSTSLPLISSAQTIKYLNEWMLSLSFKNKYFTEFTICTICHSKLDKLCLDFELWSTQLFFYKIVFHWGSSLLKKCTYPNSSWLWVNYSFFVELIKTKSTTPRKRKWNAICM